jgi:hypothetical protein
MNKILTVWAGLLGLGFVAVLIPPDKVAELDKAAASLPPDKVVDLISQGAWLAILFAFCWGVGSFAQNRRGRSWWNWFWLTVFLSPLITFPLVALSGDLRPRYRWQP